MIVYEPRISNCKFDFFKKKFDLQALITWAVGKGLPVGGDEAGFWLNYQREENTTQTASNATQQDQKTVRNRNRSLFKAGYVHSR